MIPAFNAEGYAIECALNNREAANALKLLSADDMLTPEGAEILAAIKMLDHVDLVTLNERTNYRHINYFVSNAQGMVLYSLYGQYIVSLKDQSRRRNIARAAQKLINLVDDLSENVDTAAAEFEQDLRRNTNVTGCSISSQEATMRFVDSVDAPRSTKRATFGVAKLDEHLGGVFGGKLVAIGARPATGKSALALSAAMSTQTNGDVLFCSYEMSADDIVGRAMANLSGVNSQNIAYRDLSIEQKLQMGKHYVESAQMKIHYTETANTPAKVRAEALRLNKNNTLSLIVVDYLQLMSSGRKAESRRVEVGQISRELKQLAMELSVPVFALSQLNRQSEATQSKTPTMSEMRESGDIEQDADVIVLMYQPPNDEKHVQPIIDAGYRCVRLLLEKNKQGIAGIQIDTAFSGAQMKFLRVGDVI